MFERHDESRSGNSGQAILTINGGTSSIKFAVFELSVERNRERIDYSRYLQLGLPVGSALVESLIKQMNHRVKGTEQFWTNDGLEAVLQVSAAYLSHDDRADKHHQQRPRSRAVGSNRTTNRNRNEKSSECETSYGCTPTAIHVRDADATVGYDGSSHANRSD